MRASTGVATNWEVATWAEICKRYPNEWVCLTDIENAETPSEQPARVLSHSSSRGDAWDRVRHLERTMKISLVHTVGGFDPLRGPWIVEFLDEGDSPHSEWPVEISDDDGGWP